MATLVNMFVEEIIHRVCTVEDISAEMATQLTEIYTIVVKKAPNHFQVYLFNMLGFDYFLLITIGFPCNRACDYIFT